MIAATMMMPAPMVSSMSARNVNQRPRSASRKRALTAPASANSISRKSCDTDRDNSQLPPAVALLEQVGLEISVTKEQSDLRYVLTVRHNKLQMAWRHCRSFDEYRRLQRRLLKVLSQGHFCTADCPWMYTFLKSYFPKKNLFTFVTARVIAARREALANFFSTIQSFLLNRANHSCSVMTTAFASEIVTFIYGDILNQYPLDQLSNQNNTSGLDVLGASSICDSESRDSICQSSFGMCALCDSSLDAEAYSGTNSSFASTVSTASSEPASGPLSRASSSVADDSPIQAERSLSLSAILSNSGGSRRLTTSYYVTTLGCGHQFHDECIVPKLNETLSCPTCGHNEIDN